MFFGEIQPDANTLMGFLGCLLFVLIIAEKLLKFFGAKETPKREVSFASEFASKAELIEVKGRVEKCASKPEVIEVKARVDQLETKIERQTEMLRAEMKEDKT